jgi:hypothetical protein
VVSFSRFVFVIAFWRRGEFEVERLGLVLVLMLRKGERSVALRPERGEEEYVAEMLRAELGVEGLRPLLPVPIGEGEGEKEARL